MNKIMASIFLVFSWLTVVSALCAIWTLDIRWTDTARLFGLCAFISAVAIFLVALFDSNEM